jgi:hypothetical protein
MRQKKERKGVRSPSHSTSGDALNKFSDVLDVFDEDIIDPRGAFAPHPRDVVADFIVACALAHRPIIDRTAVKLPSVGLSTNAGEHENAPA